MIFPSFRHAVSAAFLWQMIVIAWGVPVLAENPLFEGADPHAEIMDGKFWVYPTGSGALTYFDAFSSQDGKTWCHHPRVFDFADVPWIVRSPERSRLAWAPAVIQIGKRYLLYYSVGPQAKRLPSQIGVALADTPEGPFHDSGAELLRSGPGFEAIDPMVFRDPADGRLILYAGGSAGKTMRAFEMSADGIRIVRELEVATPEHFTEGPFLHRRGDTYYLSYSKGRWNNASYQAHYSTGPSALGPWTYRGLLLASGEHYKGPGHHSIVALPDGSGDAIVYHRWHNVSGHGPYKNAPRVVAIDRLSYDANGLLEPVTMTGRWADPFLRADSGAVRAVPAGAVVLDTRGEIGRRVQLHREVLLPGFLDQLERRGPVANFQKAAGLASPAYNKEAYGDAYVHAANEGGAMLVRNPEGAPLFRERQRRIFGDVLAAQAPDGYLYTSRLLGKSSKAAGPERWTNELGAKTNADSHELYSMGHFIESAVAEFRASRDPAALAAARKTAGLIAEVWGPGKLTIPPGHPGIEVALVKLFEETGERGFLDLAHHLMECRGRGGHGCAAHRDQEYYANHLPAVEQREPAGHVVRAIYLYQGMTDYARLTGDPRYRAAVEAIWEHMVGRKMYVTGGLGSVAKTEGFGPDFSLPMVSYAESCAAMASVMWAQRLFLMNPRSDYIDVMEHTLYNAVFPGLSLDGQRFFYKNPLQDPAGKRVRTEWHNTPCCLGNFSRFLPGLGGLVYATGPGSLYVNLFTPGRVATEVDGREVSLTQKTSYPWDGRVEVVVEPVEPFEFALRLRVPAWVGEAPVPGGLYDFLDDQRAGTVEILVNGKPVDAPREKGYAVLKRSWRPGDTVTLSLPLLPRRMVAREEVEAVRGKVAVQRGPVLYCLEAADNETPPLQARLPDDAALEVTPPAGRLGPIPALKAGNAPELVFVPYLAWGNRTRGPMTVWVDRGPGESPER